MSNFWQMVPPGQVALLDQTEVSMCVHLRDTEAYEASPAVIAVSPLCLFITCTFCAISISAVNASLLMPCLGRQAS